MKYLQYIKGKIDSLTTKFQTVCPFKLADYLGIHIEYEYLGEILGYFSKNFRIKMIHINESSDERLQLFTCAHELGHAVLHPNYNTNFLSNHTYQLTSKIENEANAFAVYLLSKQNKEILVNEAQEIYKIPKNFIFF